MNYKLRFILGDQLNYNHSWFREKPDHTTYVMMEVTQETDYVQHHIQKIVGFFSAMRNFKAYLQKEGFNIIYLTLDDPANKQSIPENLRQIMVEQQITLFEYLLPDEYRLDKQLKDFAESLQIETHAHDTEHFLTQRTDLAMFFKSRKQYLMESFYREMRKKHHILMDGEEPMGGRWNFDKENRNKLAKNVQVPPLRSFKHDVSDLVDMLWAMDIKTIGEIDPLNYHWPVSRAEALAYLAHFLQYNLPLFGTYQDAMHTQHQFLFHSRISFALNTKMLHPKEVVEAAVQQWQENQHTISVAQIEGYVRQIIGWREYMRGVYWAEMPEYEQLNALNHQRKIPSFYWTGKTKMNCMGHAIRQSLQHAYAHHIQRLMVTGNFGLLANIHPDDMDAWYLGIYIDAIQWVEITNVRGMSQFADGGIVGTKPYVSSANYINKMSNYCQSCHYLPKKRYGHKACPFNSLYWNFYDQHRDKFENNPRIGMMYHLWDKMEPMEKNLILEQASRYLDAIEDL